MERPNLQKKKRGFEAMFMSPDNLPGDTHPTAENASAEASVPDPEVTTPAPELNLDEVDGSLDDLVFDTEPTVAETHTESAEAVAARDQLNEALNGASPVAEAENIDTPAEPTANERLAALEHDYQVIVRLDQALRNDDRYYDTYMRLLKLNHDLRQRSEDASPDAKDLRTTYQALRARLAQHPVLRQTLSEPSVSDEVLHENVSPSEEGGTPIVRARQTEPDAVTASALGEVPPANMVTPTWESSQATEDYPLPDSVAITDETTPIEETGETGVHEEVSLDEPTRETRTFPEAVPITATELIAQCTDKPQAKSGLRAMGATALEKVTFNNDEPMRHTA